MYSFSPSYSEEDLSSHCKPVTSSSIALPSCDECRRPGSEVKRKEMFGSGIFAEPVEENGPGITSADRTCVRLHQVKICAPRTIVASAHLDSPLSIHVLKQ